MLMMKFMLASLTRAKRHAHGPTIQLIENDKNEEDDDMWPAVCTQVRIFYPAEREAAEKCPRGKWLPESYGRTQGYAEAYANAMFRPGVNATLVGTALILKK